MSSTRGWRRGYVYAAAATASLLPLAWWLLGMADRAERDAKAAKAEPRAAAGAMPGAEAEDGCHDAVPPLMATREGEAREPLPSKLRRLGRSRLYWSLTFAFVVCGVTTTGFIESHLVALATHRGMSKADGALAFGLLSACNGVGMVLAGWLSDRFHRIFQLAAIFFVRGLCYLLLHFVRSRRRLLVFAVVFGFVDHSWAQLQLEVRYQLSRDLGCAGSFSNVA